MNTLPAFVFIIFLVCAPSERLFFFISKCVNLHMVFQNMYFYACLLRCQLYPEIQRCVDY